MAGPNPNRRRFLSVCTAALIALMTGLIFAPVLAFVTSPLRRRRGSNAAGDDFSDAGALDSIPIGTCTLLPIEIVRQDGWVKTRQTRSIWVLVKGTAPVDVQVLSPICTHLGCPVGWWPGSSQFKCPCHGGTFSEDGTVVSGPPPRGMDKLEHEIRDGHLWVRWQDFRISVNERIAVQM
ncbi:MAG: ubiquinol-cytochrome c reductase iron-sulfur subunit [Planctomycetota bacterium]|nr:ubiquinol-cytochrome c reductase iron-sulfur subunit [Planctomycetota bacterium]